MFIILGKTALDIGTASMLMLNTSNPLNITLLETYTDTFDDFSYNDVEGNFFICIIVGSVSMVNKKLKFDKMFNLTKIYNIL